MKESIIQQQICDYLSAVGVFYFSIPNEHYNISHGQRVTLHKMGMLSGIPDICILANGTCYFLEVKNETGKPSKQQLTIHKALTDNGYKVAIVRSVEDVKTILTVWSVIPFLKQGRKNELSKLQKLERKTFNMQIKSGCEER